MTTRLPIGVPEAWVRAAQEQFWNKCEQVPERFLGRLFAAHKHILMISMTSTLEAEIENTMVKAVDDLNTICPDVVTEDGETRFEWDRAVPELYRRAREIWVQDYAALDAELNEQKEGE